jgi:4-amino-4-deoxy-L-arabinose transferase-like glycosyltransferase
VGDTVKTLATNLKSNKLFWVLAIALLVRGAVLVWLPNLYFPDAGAYRSTGDLFRHLHLMTDNAIMPLYPLLIALAGEGWGQKLADLVLSLISVWLVYAITLRIYRDETIALIAGLFCAIWPHFAFFAAAGLTETLFITLVLAGFLCCYDRRYALASVFFVLAILTRPAIDYLAPIIIALFSIAIHRESLWNAAKRVATYFVVYVALMSPWWVHNYARYGEFVRLDLASGMVLYTGNNPLNTSGGGITKKDVDFSQFQKFNDPVQRSQALLNAAVKFIKADPGHFVAMMPVKFARLWRPWPYTDEYHSALVVLVSVISAAPTFILALIGLAMTLRSHFFRLLPCMAYVAYLTLVHVVTFGSVRYRVPLEPFVLIFAAAGLVELLRRVEAGRQLLAPLSSTR